MPYWTARPLRPLCRAFPGHTCLPIASRARENHRERKDGWCLQGYSQVPLFRGGEHCSMPLSGLQKGCKSSSVRTELDCSHREERCINLSAVHCMPEQSQRMRHARLQVSACPSQGHLSAFVIQWPAKFTRENIWRKWSYICWQHQHDAVFLAAPPTPAAADNH